MISIGHLAKTYGLLPSEVAARATAYDLMVTDVYSTWENHQQNPTDIKDFSQEQLQEVLERSRNA